MEGTPAPTQDRRSDGTRRPRSDRPIPRPRQPRSEEHTSELQSQSNLVCRLLLAKEKQHDETALEIPPHLATGELSPLRMPRNPHPFRSPAQLPWSPPVRSRHESLRHEFTGYAIS